MTQQIKLKRNTTNTTAPTTSDIRKQTQPG